MPTLIDQGGGYGITSPSGGAGGGVALSASGSSISTGTVVFSNSNGISFGMNGSTITGTVATNYQSPGAYLTTAALSGDTTKYVENWKLTGNIAGTTSSAQGNDFWLAGGNGVTLSGSSNTVSISVATNYQSQGAYLTTAMLSNAATISNIKISGGASSLNLSAFTFADSNGISFGLSNNSVLTATVATNYQSQGAYLTTAALSGDSSKYVQNWKLAGNSAGTQSTAAGSDFWLAGGQGITLSGSSNTISFSVGSYITTAMASNAGSNFVNTNAGLNLTSISATFNSNSISLSVGAYITTAALSANTSNYAGINSGITGGSMTVNTSGISVNIPQLGFGASNTGNTSGNTGTSSAIAWVIAGTNNVTVSESTAAGGPNTLWLSAPAAGGTTFWTGSYWGNVDVVQGTSSFSLPGTVVNVQPFVMPYPISFSYIRFPMSYANMTSTTVGTTAGSSSFYFYQSINAVIYSQGGGGNSRSLQYLCSSQAAFTEAYFFSCSNAGTNESIAYQITYPSEGANTANAATTMVTTAGGNTLFLHSTGNMTNFSGIHWLDIPFASSLPPGNFWIALVRSTSTTTSGGAIAISGQVAKSHSWIALTQINSNFVPLGMASSAAATNSTYMWQLGLGSHTVSAQGATTSSLAMSSITSVANFPIIPMWFIRQV